MVEQKELSFGELLNGDRLATAPYKIAFLQDKHHEVACRRNLSVGEVLQLQSAIRQDYYYQMFCDNMPIWGFLGHWEREAEDDESQKFFLYQDIELEISYNKDQIIGVSLMMNRNSGWINLTDHRETYIEPLYSVKWVERNDSFLTRMDKYKVSNHYHYAIHWNSILSSCWTFLILATGLSLYYVRVVRKDFSE